MAGKILVGVFTTRAAADRAIADLRNAGYKEGDIGMVMRDEEGKPVQRDAQGRKETNSGEGATIGAVAGGATAAAVTAGIMSGVIPVIGPILALGPIAVALINIASGAAAVGVAGALIGMGLPKEDSDFYENEVRAGRILVTVAESAKKDVGEIFKRHGGYDRLSGKSMV